ncbi:hypothetical protein PhCBS80983_g05898 [Powellomyces hirtus]|uniref:Uncharacterized protein n=1 Tax=Powellomyces hirtus TaxID=109895 RepID=A0A507DRY5_9FUNG|nr:hypothetical protein PhCBS80983_g05898 [Powellomyces hirtus]
MSSLALFLTLLLTFLLSATAQEAPANPAPAPSPVVPGGRPSASASATALPTRPPTASPSPSVLPLPPCGASQGAIFITNPTRGSTTVVGSTLNITWTYSDLTDKARFPAKNIALYYQRADQGVTPTGWKPIIEDLNPKATVYTWTVPNVQDGQFFIRIAADGIDPQRSTNPDTRCVPDTFPGPSNSQQFLITALPPLQTFPDNLGPNSAAEKSTLVTSITSVVAAVSAVEVLAYFI